MNFETLPGADYSKRKTRRGYESLLAVDPHDHGEWDVLLSAAKIGQIAQLGKRRPGAIKELIDTVRWSLRGAKHIFRGVRDDKQDLDEDPWLCYVARPSHAFDWKTGERRQAWVDEVFLLYVTDERVVYHWYWDHCDPDNPALPLNYRLRFGKQVF
jgi:hypothetical protein